MGPCALPSTPPADLERAIRGAFNEMEDLYYRIARRRPRDYSYASVRHVLPSPAHAPSLPTPCAPFFYTRR